MNNYKKFLVTFLSLAFSIFVLSGVVLAAGEPTVTGIDSTKTNGYYRAGESIPIQITFSSSVAVLSGTSTLKLVLNSSSSAGASAAYTSGTGSTTLTFTYVVAAGDNSSDLDAASSTALTGGVIVLSSNIATSAILTVTTTPNAGSLAANKALVIDTIAPTSTATSTLGVISDANASGTIVLTITFSENMASTTVNPTLTFSPNIVGTGSLTFSTSTWASSTQYQATYTLVDATDSNYDVDVVMTIGQDLAGNTVTSTQTALIDLDTTAPSSLTVNPPATSYGEVVNVVLASTGSTQIRYTIDGTTPTCSSGSSYSSAISVTSSLTLKAFACDVVSNSAALSTNIYTISVNTGGGGSNSGGSSGGTSGGYTGTPAIPATPATPGVSPATPATPAVSAAQAQLTALMAQLQTLIAQAQSKGINVSGVSGASSLSSGSANLTVGSRSESVRNLQSFLVA
ncbi:MAG: chitobiase/beta-hexosaminidase C-terminal domain-containing protein, partial [bacterium]|nr:chitobiase/beta-hexosaminidase C-terminal domain-containing protein [bacterium]